MALTKSRHCSSRHGYNDIELLIAVGVPMVGIPMVGVPIIIGNGCHNLTITSLILFTMGLRKKLQRHVRAV